MSDDTPATPRDHNTSTNTPGADSRPAKGNTALKIGVGVLAGAVIAGGATFGIMNASNSSDEGPRAVSAAIWHDVDTENLPEGWSMLGERAGDTALAYHQSPVSLGSDNNCNFVVSHEMLDTPEFTGTPANYHAVNRVLGYGSFRDATDTELKEVPVETSEGEVNFWSAAYTLKYDIDGDGKENNVREVRMAAAYPEAADKDGRIPMTEIGYVCNDASQFSDDELSKLLGAFTFNISGDDAPALPESADGTGNEGAEPSDAETPAAPADEEPTKDAETPTASDGQTTANPADVPDERDATEAPSDVETSDEVVDATEGNLEGVESGTTPVDGEEAKG